MADWRQPLRELPVGKGQVLREGGDLAVLTIGPVGNQAADAIDLAAQEGISALHADLRFAKPLDEELLHGVGKRFKKVLTVENGVIKGGVGSAVLEFMNANGYDCRVEMLGIPDRFIEQGKIAELQRLCGFDTEGILAAIRALHAEKGKKTE